jgi:hypothetical protein
MGNMKRPRCELTAELTACVNHVLSYVWPNQGAQVTLTVIVELFRHGNNSWLLC